ncbi:MULTISPECIES: TonB-dependent receptor [Bacteroides]|uniref:TonB-dependent receptor plug domain-containing protein n=1 Tax=Bacteroides TaxID=816 RepID=UPI000E44D42E|nr:MULTISPECIES: TonB-dependent receptor [Bacteroides]MBS7574351.1 TonB-dependent receptor [Bacteroides propionicigenes]RGM26931.1 TonB-dependent receptor [Bacteroides sp. OM08-17BH]HBO06016.1 TonB-dependent receptor [Bacteroides sp.]
MKCKYLFGVVFLYTMHSATAQSILENKSEKELSLMLQEVVVTGTGTEHYLKDAPVQTEVINRKTLDSYGGTSLEEILTGLCPSFDFNTSDMGSNMQLGGLGNGYVLLLIDGKKVHGDVGGQNNLGLIDPSRIERIEIVKGASSALYGSDAMAGVVNIITKKHRDDILIKNTTRGGSYGEIRQSNTIQFKFGKWTSSTNFQLKHSDGWQNTMNEDPNRYEYPVTNSINKTVNRYTDWQVSQRFDYQLSKAISLYADGDFYRKRIYRPCGIPDYKTYDFLYRNASVSTGGKLKLKNSNSIMLDIHYDSHAYYYAYTRETWDKEFDNNGKEISFPYFAGDKGLQSNQSRLLIQAKGVFNLPYFNRLSVGSDTEINWLDAPRRLDEENVSDYTTSVYAQDEWSPINRFNITAGARLTVNKNFGTRLTPKVSALYKLGDFNLRATYSEGFKTPTLKELHYRYIRQMSLVILNLGNRDLEPQTSRYVSGGIEYNGKKFSISATGYCNWLENMITLITIPTSQAPGDLVITYDPARVRQYQNMDDAHTYGADVNVKWMPGRSLIFTGGYSYLDTKANQYDEEDEVMKHVIIDGMAHHRATIGATWSHDWKRRSYRLGLGVYGRIQSKRYYQDDGDGKGYNTWRLNTRHQFSLGHRWDAEINAGIDNLFNYYETTYHGLHYGTTTAGRTFYASLMIQFGQKKTKK